MSRIVLAYSGSARSSVAIRWMIEAWQVEIVTLTLDLGQRDELDAVRERALSCGAVRAHVLDERESFARDYLLPALRAGAVREDGRPLGRVLTRPLIARQLVDVARMEGVAEVAHGCAQDHEDRTRLERAIRDAGPDMLARAPLVEASLSDNEMLTFAEAHDLPIGRIRQQGDANLWERCARVIAPNAPDTSDTSDVTASDATTPDVPAIVALEFSTGKPVGLNGVTMPLLEIISSLETIASAHGIGRTQQLARLADGTVVQQHCNAPAATLLDVALRQFERLVLPPDAWRDLQHVSSLYRDIVFRGAWGAASRRGCDAFIETIQAQMTGAVRLRLFKGSVEVIDCASAGEYADAAPTH